MIETRISQREEDALLKMAYDNYTEIKKEIGTRQTMTGKIEVLVLSEIERYGSFSRADVLHVRRIPQRKKNDRKRIGVAKVYGDGKFINWEIIFHPRVTYVGRANNGDSIRFTRSQKEYNYFNNLLSEAKL